MNSQRPRRRRQLCGVALAGLSRARIPDYSAAAAGCSTRLMRRRFSHRWTRDDPGVMRGCPRPFDIIISAVMVIELRRGRPILSGRHRRFSPTRGDPANQVLKPADIRHYRGSWSYCGTNATCQHQTFTETDRTFFVRIVRSLQS